jgi:hypothetical protein
MVFHSFISESDGVSKSVMLDKSWRYMNDFNSSNSKLFLVDNYSGY